MEKHVGESIMSPRKKFWIPVITELTGLALTAGGIGYEAAYHADLGFVMISTGSAFIAFGSILFAKFKPWFTEKGGDK